MKREPKPRNSNFMGMHSTASYGKLGTWLEPEELTYPSGAMLRRCYAVNVDTGRLQVVKCGIPDTVWTIGTSKGYIDVSDGGIFRYHPSKKEVK